jgi:hypothetical protein
MKFGERSAEVGNLQRFLSSMDFRDVEGKRLIIDEHFGSKTQHALCAFQFSEGLNMSGTFDALTSSVARAKGFIPFVQAQNFTPKHPKFRDVSLIVIHTMETAETDGTAENIASWFAGKNKKYPAPRASAHYMIDNDSIVQSVRDDDVAWGAGKVNDYAIHFEHAGTAKQSAEQWGDEYSTAMLKRSAALLSRKCKTYGIPLVRLTDSELRAKKSGVCGHDQVSRVFGGTHWDPGPHFPWDLYLATARESL